jgi:hypothetical protein
MRVVLKPLGVVVLVAAFATALVAPRLMGSRAPNAPATPGAEPTAAAPPQKKSAPGQAVAAAGESSLLRAADWKFYTEPPAQADRAALAGADLPSSSASGSRFTVRTVGKNPWNVGFNNILTAESFRAGETLTVTFHARSRTRSQVCALLQENSAPYAHCWKRYVSLTPEWKEYRFSFRAARYERGGALFAIFLGFAPGTIDMTDVRLVRGGDGSDGTGSPGA